VAVAVAVRVKYNLEATAMLYVKVVSAETLVISAQDETCFCTVRM